MPNSIVHFEIPADDLKRAKKFYEKALGWKISDPWKMDYFLVETKEKGEEGINGGLLKRKMPGHPFMNYIAVASIDDSLKKVAKAGGVIAMPKTEIGQGMGWIAAFKDTEGNIMGFHQMSMKQPETKKPEAKKPEVKKPEVKKAEVKKAVAAPVKKPAMPAKKPAKKVAAKAAPKKKK